MAAKMVRGEIDTAPVASETSVVTPSATVRSTTRARGLTLTLSCRLDLDRGIGYRCYFNRQDSPPKLTFMPARTVKGSAGKPNASL